MTILIIAGIALIIGLVVILLITGGNKKINYKDRIKLESILENEEQPEKDADNHTSKANPISNANPISKANPTSIPPTESSDVIPPKNNVQDDSIINKLSANLIGIFHFFAHIFRFCIVTGSTTKTLFSYTTKLCQPVWI